MEINKIYCGDSLEVLKTFSDKSVNCCITSPPYWGLRDYGVEGQLGLEKTPQEYVDKMVELFREVRRVLKDDGTLWLNLGDSYCGTGDKGDTTDPKYADGRNGQKTALNNKIQGLKQKDLVGIPWALATALRDPYYIGDIKAESDRVWLAAMIDAEGCICGSYHIRKDDGSPRTNISITITNTNELILDKASSIFPNSSKHEHESHYEGHLGKRDSWRWHVFSIEGKQKLIREIYPYLIAKKKQAMVAWNFLKYQEDAKHYGKTPQKQNIRDLRKEMVMLLSSLNKGEDVPLPQWMEEPPSLYEQGYYLRQDIIWAKPNPMPESVTDRCTKSHEYIFLLSKSQKYYYDYEAILEPVVDQDRTNYQCGGRTNGINEDRNDNDFGERSKTWKPKMKNLQDKGQQNHSFHESRVDGIPDEIYAVRNKRDVWTVTTKPFKEAHFATFPEKLIVDMVKAGCPEGGTVLDPFMGAGTTGLVTRKLNRNYVGCELNPKYIKIAEKRIIDEIGLFL